MTTQPTFFIPHDRRTTVFFWLGIIVLPVFWAWFTLGKFFSRWQRVVAFTWAVGQALLFWCTFPQIADRYSSIVIGLPAISICLTLGLFGWLIVRVSKITIFELICGFVVFGQGISVLHSIIDSLGAASEFSWKLAIMPLAPALLILAADPEHRFFNQAAALVRGR